MKKAAGILLLSLLLALTLGMTVRAADGQDKLIPFPGEAWILTNGGTEGASVSLRGMDYVVTDADGMVTDRDVSRNKNITVPAGGQAIVQYCFNPTNYSEAITLPEGVTTVKCETPLLLHADLSYGDTCEFRNVTDHSANVLIDRAPGMMSNPGAVFIYSSDGALERESSGGLISVPAGGRAVVTTQRGADAQSPYMPILSCMARAENFTMTYDVPLDWTFGYLGRNETAAFTNVSSKPQTISWGDDHALYYAGGEGAKLKELNKSAFEVPPGCSVALGCSSLKGAGYRFLTDAFEPVNLPGPVYHKCDSNGETIWTNESEYKAPVYGITKKMAETTYPDQIAVYAFGARQNVVEATDDGSGIYIPKGGRLVISRLGLTITTLSGQFTVTGEKPATTDDYVVLRAGQLLTIQRPLSARSATIYGGQPCCSHTDITYFSDENEDGMETTSYESAGTTIFLIPADCERTLTNETMMETVTLSKGKSCTFTLRPESDGILHLRGAFLCRSNWNDGSLSSPVSWHFSGPMSQLHPRDCSSCVLTALEDGCRVEYNRMEIDAAPAARSPIAVDVIPEGESRVYLFRNLDNISINDYRDFCRLNVFGLNTEVLKYNWGWGEDTYTVRASSNQVSFEQHGTYACKPLRITAAGSETLVAYLPGYVLPADCLLWSDWLSLQSEGRSVSEDELGKTDIDTAQLTLYTDLTKPFTLILAAYDQAGKLVRTVQSPVAAAASDEVRTVRRSIPFSCGTETAKIKLMAVDRQFRPLMDAVVMAGGD